MDRAPFHADLAEGPQGGAAHWLTAADGVRLRAAHYPAGRAGTVLMFPGRTEYCEKYGRAAAEFGRRGFAMATIDWRGQGLSDRAGATPQVGHVTHFAEFQADVAALAGYATTLDLPRPFFLCAHSMGGAIGLRALHRGLAVSAAVFSAPMWGIRIRPALRPAAHAISAAGRRLGLGARPMPFTETQSFVADAPFEGNLLTTDPAMFAYMRGHAQAVPDLCLGGPSLGWVAAGLAETRNLMRRPAPAIACTTFVGSDEAIVSAPAIETRMANWPDGRFQRIAGARHELMMERPALRDTFFDGAANVFTAARESDV